MLLITYTKNTLGLTVSRADRILESNSTGESAALSSFESFELAFFLSAALSSAPGFLFASVVKTYKNGNTFICLRLGRRQVMTIDTQKRKFWVVDALEIMKRRWKRGGIF